MRRTEKYAADGLVTKPSAFGKNIYGHNSQGGHTPVVLGEEVDEALLGIVTLEILGLVLNPFTRTLQPTRMVLA
jgi:hypothetical protein